MLRMEDDSECMPALTWKPEGRRKLNLNFNWNVQKLRGEGR